MIKSSPLYFSWLGCQFLTIDFSCLFLSFSGNKASTTSLGSLFHWQTVTTRIHFNAYTIANPSLKLAHHRCFIMTTDKTKLYKSHWDQGAAVLDGIRAGKKHPMHPYLNLKYFTVDLILFLAHLKIAPGLHVSTLLTDRHLCSYFI